MLAATQGGNVLATPLHNGRIVRCRSVFAAFALAVALSGCGWAQFGAGPDHTSWNPLERTVGVANVGGLHELWRAQAGETSSPTVANGIVYVGSPNGKLYAFDARSLQNCSGSPTTCPPLWTGQTGGPISFSSPAVVDGNVYIGSLDRKLYVFDARGQTNCSGTPTTCQPLWTAATDEAIFSSPAVANGFVYVVSTAGTLSAYDAHGITNCSGSPATCVPLWSTNPAPAETSASPAVANGFVYLAYADARVYAFDAAGETNCAGIPKTCHALWTGAVTGDPTSPVVANGMLYVGTFGDESSTHIYAFDAAGQKNCSASRMPRSCEPLWTAATNDQLTSMLAVANNRVYAVDHFGGVYAFDAKGQQDCSGAPVTCTPLWTGQFTGLADFSALAVANGVLYIGAETGPDAPSGTDHGAVFAFDASGTTGCSGTPAFCEPIASFPTDRYVNGGSPAVLDGRLYVGDTGGTLYALAL